MAFGSVSLEQDSEGKRSIKASAFVGDNTGTVGTHYNSGKVTVTIKDSDKGTTRYSNDEAGLLISVTEFVNPEDTEFTAIISGKFLDEKTKKEHRFSGTFNCFTQAL
jgi:hypothetical protein